MKLSDIILLFILVVVAYFLIVHVFGLVADAGAIYCRVVWASYRWQGYDISFPMWCCGYGYNVTCSRACWRGYGYGPCW